MLIKILWEVVILNYNINELKNFIFSSKKHIGNREEQILYKKNQIKKLEREIEKLCS
jgi:hypothetical protein